MAQVSNEMLYEEILKLDLLMAETEATMTDLVAFMKDMNKELAEGHAKTEALKQRLVKGRLDHQGAFIG